MSATPCSGKRIDFKSEEKGKKHKQEMLDDLFKEVHSEKILFKIPRVIYVSFKYTRSKA